jgi:hypothetical protein
MQHRQTLKWLDKEWLVQGLNISSTSLAFSVTSLTGLFSVTALTGHLACTKLNLTTTTFTVVTPSIREMWQGKNHLQNSLECPEMTFSFTRDSTMK